MKEIESNMQEGTNKKRIASAMVISVISVILSCGISLVITPLVTNSVGTEAYGFVTLARNFTSYADILMIALNSYAARYITIAYYRHDEKKFNRYFSTVFFADLFLGLAIFVVGVVCTINLQNLLNISGELVNDVKLLFLLTFFAFFMTSMTTAFNSITYIKDRIDLLNLVKVFSYITEILIFVFCFLQFTARVWYLGFASLGMACVTLFGAMILAHKLLPDAKIKVKNYSGAAVKDLVYSGIWNSANSMGNTLNSGLDLLITNLMLNGLVMGQISIAKTISSIVSRLYDVISQPFQPTLLKDYSDENKTRLISHFKEIMRLSGLATNVVFAGFCAVGINFYRIWIPTQNYQFIYILTILALIPSITEGCMQPLYYTYTLTLKNKFPCIVTIIGGLLNVGSMYVLLKHTGMGAYAVLITTAVIMTFINTVTNPIYCSKCLKVPISTFYPTIIRNIISCGITSIVLMGINHFLPFPDGWLFLVIRIIICGIAGILVQAPIMLSNYEIKNFMSVIKAKIRK